LPDILTVCAGGGAVLGAIVGFALPPKSDRELMENVVGGAQIGAVAVSAGGFLYWTVRSLAGA